MKIIIKIEKEDMNMLQATMYMCNSKKDVLTYVLGNKFMTINGDLFDKYCSEYTNAYIEHECCKEEISHKYIGGLRKYVNNSSLSWNVDFATGLMLAEFEAEESLRSVLKEEGYDVR